MEQVTATKIKVNTLKVSRTNHNKMNDVDEAESFLFIEQHFDTNGNKIKEIIYDETEEVEQIVEYKYDDENLLIEEFHNFIHDEINEKTTFKYQDGKLIEKLKEFSIGSYEKTLFTYNENGLITNIKTIDEDGEEEESETFAYEQKNLVHHTKQNALVGKEFEHWMKYNANNKLTEETRWESSTEQTFTTVYDYSKNGDEPDAKVMNKKGDIVEAYRRTFDDSGKLIKTEVQTAHGNLRQHITTYRYDDLNRLIFLETLDSKDNVERRIATEFDDNGLLISEIKTEYEIGHSSVNTFTLKYDYTFH